mmetsp:Transcript_6458/g.19152  ORF Transcript_6458/g.19152 Transcript_6458/m.19152 type:complete len:429 (+) Transcript_6458:129-1415(+)
MAAAVKATVPDEACAQAAAAHDTPLYLYSAAELDASATEALEFPAPYGLTVRYAMKACPNAAIIGILVGRGLCIDASSTYEAARAIAAGVSPRKICISSQELRADFGELVEVGVELNACSLRQLATIGKQFPGASVGVRFNPGMGSGAFGRTNVGGPDASFGIWHENMDEVKKVAAEYKLKIIRVHTHIGSGSDPEVWAKVSKLSIDMCRHFPEATVLNLGGGYKVARMPDEASTCLQSAGAPVRKALEVFAEETGRKLHLEIEPGAFLVARAGVLVARVQDIVTTGDKGRRFLKLDTGMTEMLRPQMYGAMHGMRLVRPGDAGGEPVGEQRYVVVGHCCESGDIFTPKQHEPEVVDERSLPKAAVGDLLVIEGAGAYCASMSAKHYNSYPEAPEVLLGHDGEVHLIRARQSAEQLWENEVALPDGVI